LDNNAKNYVASLAKIPDPDLRGQASIGSEIVLDGAAELTKPRVIPWRQILLWGILVGPVASAGGYGRALSAADEKLEAVS